MLITSTTATVPFTPAWAIGKPDAPVYHLRAGDVIERGMMEAELSGPMQAGRVYDFEIRAAIRSGVVALLDGDDEQAALLALIDAESGGESVVTTPAEQALLAEARKVLGAHWPEYRDLVAQLERRRELAPIVALRRFCTGWENVSDETGKPVTFDRGRDGLISATALSRLTPLEMTAAGNRAFSLQYVTEEDKGNSSPPSSSVDGQATSNSDDTSKAAGKSKGANGRKTRASRSPRGSGRSSTSSS